MWSWQNDKAEKRFNEIMRAEGFERGSHTYTRYSQEEDMLEVINQLVAIFSMIKINGLIRSEEDIKNIKEQLNDSNIICSPTFDILLKNAVIEEEKGLSVFY